MFVKENPEKKIKDIEQYVYCICLLTRLWCHKFEIKDTHRENTRSSKTQALTKSINMDIWVIGALNQLFRRGSYTQLSFWKNKVIVGKTPFYVIGLFCTTHLICLNIGFWLGSFAWHCWSFNRKTWRLKWKMVYQFFRKGFSFS